jgi:hypothetical protein
MLVVLAWTGFGCTQVRQPPPPFAPAPFSQYRCGDFNWPAIRRVVIVPLWNESSEPTASRQIAEVLCAELQTLGHFEVLIACLECPPEWSRGVRVSGRFDEIQLVELANEYHADAVLCGAVTHYHAYAPPRIGLSLRMISTAEGIVIASLDGLWDARDRIVADEARSYYGHTVTLSQASASPDVILGSPRLFQKYVCAHASWMMGTQASIVGIAPGPALAANETTGPTPKTQKPEQKRR